MAFASFLKCFLFKYVFVTKYSRVECGFRSLINKAAIIFSFIAYSISVSCCYNICLLTIIHMVLMLLNRIFILLSPDIWLTKW